MDDMFKNAYFGKAYKTRDERKAIYIQDTMEHRMYVHQLVFEDGYSIYCSKYGKVRVSDSPLDIVSEWKEEIDEEELNKIAYKYENSLTVQDYDYLGVTDFYKAGYRKAKEE